MTNKEIQKKQLIYRSTHRGTKEMGLLLGSFVKEYINKLSQSELTDLENLLKLDDEILFRWYFENIKNPKIDNNKISEKLKTFKV